MSARLALALVSSLALAGALAIVVGLSPSPEAPAPRTLPAPSLGRAAAGPAAAEPETLSPAPQVAGDGAFERAAQRPHVTAQRSLTVTLTAAEGARVQLPVDLLFGAGPGAVRQRLHAGRAGVATWTAGDAETWPASIDLGFPTRGAALTAVGESSAVALTVPPLATVRVRVEELDGALCSEEATVELRAPTSPAPADRWHTLRAGAGTCAAVVEAAGEAVEVRVTTVSGRVAGATLRAPRAAGEQVDGTVQLDAVGGTRFTCSGLPERDRPWSVELFGADGRSRARAPRDGDAFLSFARAAPRGVQPTDDGALVLARCGDDLWWGVLVGRAAKMIECAPLARGELVGAAGRELVGAPIELLWNDGATPRLLQTVRTGRRGAFALLGPDATQLSLSLRVPATGEVVALPRRQPLLLRAVR